MAKINLLTIHWGYSNGAVLQTYATAKLLMQCGHEVSVINITHPTKYRLNPFKRETYKYFFTHLNYERFRKQHFPKLTKQMRTIDVSKLPAADYYVIGSDQVWNKDVTSSNSQSFFLDFITNVKKIALASSFGKSKWEESAEYTAKVRELLKDFDAIAVREDSGVDICKDIFNVNAIQVVDPTLALADFNNFISDKKNKKNIFSFFINKIKDKNQILATVSRELNKPLHKESKTDVLFRRSPRKWLENIYNAEYIVTDSFHGVVFSLLFNKQFIVVIGNKAKATRLISLLKLIGLSERAVSSLEELKSNIEILHKEIDFARIMAIIKEEQEKYIKFIYDNIK